jgi:hypothetical protein
LAKLPAFSAAGCLFTSKSLEQASSEQLALYKSKLFRGGKMLDLSGGLGADDAAFAKTFKHVTSLDTDSRLNEIARYNFNRLRLNNIERVDADAYEFIKSNVQFDLIYIDADRRAISGYKKAITLYDSEPSILKIKNRLFEIAPVILLKLSPMADITYLKKSLPEAEHIRVISYKNEVKEILVTLSVTHAAEIQISAADIGPDGVKNEFAPSPANGEKPATPAEADYFYEAGAALVKAGLAAEYSVSLDMAQASENSPYFFSGKLHDNYFGRTFRVAEMISFSKSAVRQYLEESGITKANVAARNFPANAEELSKLFELKDGGEEYLFFTSDYDKSKWLIHCRKC